MKKQRQKNKNSFSLLLKILAVVVLLFGLPFYFGYGNPLPFIDASYSLYDNLWLSIFPIMFISLGLSLKHQLLAGKLLSIVLGIGFILSVFLGEGIPWPMLLPFLMGVFNWFLGNRNRAV